MKSILKFIFAVALNILHYTVFIPKLGEYGVPGLFVAIVLCIVFAVVFFYSLGMFSGTSGGGSSHCCNHDSDWDLDFDFGSDD